MMGLDKWKVIPLGPQDRDVAAHCLGLDRFRIDYVEKSGTQVLRHWKVRGSKVDPVFPAMSPQAPEEPYLLKVHPPRQVAEVGLFAAQNLWDEIIPFPLSQLAANDVQAVPSDWEHSGRELVTAVRKLEQRMFEAEIAVVTFEAEDVGPLSLFSHSVRKRFLTFGKLEGSVSDLTDEIIRERLAASFQHIVLRVGAADSLPSQVALISQAASEPALRSTLVEEVPSLKPSEDSKGLPL